ncbi:MAG: hypothetical protein KAG99_11630, partial [Bacteroidales bacterium]|nr:hypothetical protein [Bacteroidales bacterium]
MKKLILSLLPFVLFSLMIQAQTLTLSNGDGDVPDGSEISLLASPDVYEIESHIFVTNNTGDTVDVWLTKVETNVIAETTNYFCWGACYPPGQNTSTQSIAIPGGATDSASFSGHYQSGGLQGTSTFTYIFFILDAPDDSVRFIMNYILGYAGLADHLLAETKLSEA